MRPKLSLKILTKNKFLLIFYFKLLEQYRYFRPKKAARVFIRKRIGREQFFEILNKRNINYVLLRWWENFPSMPPGEDMDILIKDEHRDLINDLITFRDNGSDLKCDIYTISGSRYGSHNDVPYFQINLARTLLNTRVPYKGVYVPNATTYFASLAYHAVFHKGATSGIPGFGVTASDIEHNYAAILEGLANEIGIDVQVSATGLYKWLTDNNFAPGDDTLSKLVVIKPELALFEKSLYSDIRGGEVIVYAVREKLINDGLLDEFTRFLQDEYQFDIITIRMLNAQEQDYCSSQIRGGKWDKGPYKYSGGLPAALVVAFDYHPIPLNPTDQNTQPRMTNKNNMDAKYSFRKKSKKLSTHGNYNGVHSSDNELDAWLYISTLGEEFYQKVLDRVEYRRTRYAKEYKVKRLLASSPISKEELIVYGDRLAVKKTFRVGKEKFFERELYAAKVLSKELDFIPPLLEEGDGYIITPFHPNILDKLTEKEKKQSLKIKRKEIVRIIREMYNRGLAFINFNPSSIIITSENKLLCTGFEYLYTYSNKPFKIEDAYEIAGIPNDFTGDFPKALSPHMSSYIKVWGPYLGRW